MQDGGHRAERRTLHFGRAPADPRRRPAHHARGHHRARAAQRPPRPAERAVEGARAGAGHPEYALRCRYRQHVAGHVPVRFRAAHRVRQQSLRRALWADPGASKAGHDAAAAPRGSCRQRQLQQRRGGQLRQQGRRQLPEGRLGDHQTARRAISLHRAPAHARRRPAQHARGHQRARAAERPPGAAEHAAQGAGGEAAQQERPARCRPQQHAAGPRHVRQPAAARHLQQALCRDVRPLPRAGETRHDIARGPRASPRQGRIPGQEHRRAAQRQDRARRRAEGGPIHQRAERRPPNRRVHPADARRRHGDHASRHHRAAPVRGQDRPHGAARHADGPAQPRAAQRAPRGRAAARQARRDRGHAAARSRSLQDRERHPRPPRGRQAADGGGRPAARRGAGDRHDRAHGRRRVRHRADGHRPAGRRYRAGAPRHRERERALRDRGPPGGDRHQRRHRGRPLRRHEPRPADQERRPGALSRQGRRARHLPLLRARHGRADAGAARPGIRPARGARGRPVRAVLSARASISRTTE